MGVQSNSSAAPAQQGLVFRRFSDGSRSSQRAGGAIVAAALEPLEPRHAALARQERYWRRTYGTHLRHWVEDAIAAPLAVPASAAGALAMAGHSLRWLQAGEELSLPQAMQAPVADTAGELLTHTLRGAGAAPPAPWTVPYRGTRLSGDALRRRIDAWEQRGIIEASAAAALHRCSRNPDWFDLSDRTLVLLGAGSEAGPLPWLARWRANLLAVDLTGAALWTRIGRSVEAGNATLHLPVPRRVRKADSWVDLAGADLLLQTPQIARWVCSFGGALDIAALAYADGERHVRLVAAMDLVQQAACATRPDTSLAFLATPTDVFAVPRATALATMEAFRRRPVISRAAQGPLRLAYGKRFFQPNVSALLAAPDGTEYGVVDSLVLQQGPNYALAKRLQQWRALAARAGGHRVSLNVAPSTTTASVLSNRALAAGFAGAGLFGIEAFRPETTSALMAALWVHDLRCDEAAANPARALAHPLELFMDNACHGGMWRCPYVPRTALPFAAALGWVRRKIPGASG